MILSHNYSISRRKIHETKHETKYETKHATKYEIPTSNQPRLHFLCYSVINQNELGMISNLMSNFIREFEIEEELSKCDEFEISEFQKKHLQTLLILKEFDKQKIEKEDTVIPNNFDVLCKKIYDILGRSEDFSILNSLTDEFKVNLYRELGYIYLHLVIKNTRIDLAIKSHALEKAFGRAFIKCLFKLLDPQKMGFLKHHEIRYLDIGVQFSGFFDDLYKKIVIRKVLKTELKTTPEHYYVFNSLTEKVVETYAMKYLMRHTLMVIKPTPWKFQEDGKTNYSGGYVLNEKNKWHGLINQQQHDVKFMSALAIDALNIQQSYPISLDFEQFNFICSTENQDYITEQKINQASSEKERNKLQGKFVEQKYFENDIKKLQKKLSDACKIWETKIELAFNCKIILDTNSFVYYIPLCFDWRLRFVALAPINYINSKAFRAMMSSYQSYYAEKADFYPYLLNYIGNPLKKAGNYEEWAQTEPFLQQPRTISEINCFIKDKKEPLKLRRTLIEFFKCPGETDLLVGLDCTSSCFQLQQIALLNAYYEDDLNFTTLPHYGDIYAKIANLVKSSIKMENQKFEKYESIYNSKEKVTYQKTSEEIITKYKTKEKKNEKKTKLSSTDTTLFKEPAKAYREVYDVLLPEEDEETIIDTVHVLPLEFGDYQINNVLNELSTEQFRKIIKSIVMPAAYNATADSIIEKVKPLLESFKIKMILRKQFLVYFVNRVLKLIKSLNLLDFNKIIKRALGNTSEHTFYHLSGAMITASYVKHDKFYRKQWYVKTSDDRTFRKTLTLSKRLIPDVAKLKASTCPNITQSMDAAVMHFLILLGFYVFCVHDCFNVTLKDAKRLEKEMGTIMYNVFAGISTYNDLKFKNRDITVPLLAEYFPDACAKYLSLLRETNFKLLHLEDLKLGRFIIP